MWPFKSKEQKQQELFNNTMRQATTELEQIFKANNIQYDGAGFGNSASRYLSGGYDHSDRLHQIFEDFGYPEQLSFNNFWNMYRRFGVAKTVVNTMPNMCWSSHPMINGLGDDFAQLVDKANLWNRLKGLDKRQRVGAYAGAFIEVRDGMTPDKPMKRVEGGINSIVNIKPIYEGQLTPNQLDDSGNALMYQYQPNQAGTRNPNETKPLTIHPSRLVMWAEGADDGSIWGTSELEDVFNDLMDMRKISGAGAEGSYQNSRSVPIFEADPTRAAPTGKDKEVFDNAIDDWLNKYRKRLYLGGMKPHFNNVTLPNPKETYQVSLNNVSGGSGLPQAWITGQITGVLAGNKDFNKIMMDANSRRINFLNEGISMFIDWFMLYGVIGQATYEIEWDDLLAASDEDKIKLAGEMAKTNRENFLAGQGAIYSEEEIRGAAGFSDGEEFDLPDEGLDDDNQEE